MMDSLSSNANSPPNNAVTEPDLRRITLMGAYEPQRLLGGEKLEPYLTVHERTDGVVQRRAERLVVVEKTLGHPGYGEHISFLALARRAHASR